MKLKERANRIGEQLDELYPNPPIPLDHRDGFTLLIAVLLSAQTTDKRVNLVTPALFEMASTVEEMASCTEEAILEKIRTVGLAPTKARHIHALSEQLLRENGGELPSSLEGLKRLPGVGQKTASVVMSQWYDEPAFPVDTHIHRLAARWGLSSGKNVATTEADLKALFPRDTWNRRHLQMIYFGREYCPARGHNPNDCPICSTYLA